VQTIEIFLILCLGHLATDFLLQTHSLVARKKRGVVSAYIRHGVTHYLAILIVAAVAAPSYLSQPRFEIAVAALTAIHVLIDWAKIRIAKIPRITDGALLFLADQAMHLITIAGAALWCSALPQNALAGMLQALRSRREVILAVLVIYVASVFPPGYIIRYLTKSLVSGLPTKDSDQSSDELQNAGMYIGWLERTLILIAMVLRSPAAIGLVLTAKSIVRYQELRSARFVEYFLIGTLLSMVLAMLAGIAMVKVLYGSAAFPF
jgi:hypothetical protein